MQKNLLRGKAPWVDPACADCPGFLVARAADAFSRASSRSLKVCPWTSICFMASSRKVLDLLPAPPLPLAQP